VILYQYEFSQQSTLDPCPCAATKCCYLGLSCVDL
jgi:hypothetical protein